MNGALEAVDAAFGYEPGQTVFSGVSTSLRGGDLMGIVGPNGSGKSTLLRVLSGLLKPREGRVTLDGRPIGAYSPLARSRRLAFLPQSVDPAFALNAFEVVCLGRYPHAGAMGGLRRRDLEVAERCLRETGAAGLRDRDFMTLSGGERQRVLIASILAQEPAFLLLDEPTSSLDIHHQIEVFTLLQRLAGEGYSVAVVTHDLNLAARFCTGLLLLSGEEGLAAAGTPADVLTEPLLSQAYAASIRVSVNPITGTPLVTAEAVEHAP